MYRNKEIGDFGENIATKYLEKLNYEIICRNFRCKMGEIDIIAKDKKEIVFVEVKTRYCLSYGRPSEAINKLKQEHLYKTANYYLYKNHLKNINVRFDAIEIYLKGEKIKVEHLKNIEICQ